MKLRFLMFAFAILAAVAAPRAQAATEYYVAPLGTAPSGTPDGSETHPWLSIGDAISSGTVVGGDTLLLLDGDFGILKISGESFDTPIIIQSLNGKLAHFERINIGRNVGNLTFKNLSIWLSNAANADSEMVYSHPSSSNITLENLVIRGAGKNSQNYLSWGLGAWANIPNGIRLSGANSIVRNNSLTAVGAGITTTGNDALVVGNTIEGYAADGMRGFGERSIFRGNKLLNCMEVSNNHDDGFQSWAPKGVANASVKGLVIEGNSFIEWAADENHPLRCEEQGIGLFDGFYENLTIRNNLVSVSQFHGISVYGGRNVVIVNNTVVNNRGIVGKAPWIGVFNHKDGTPSENVLVANNVAMKFVGASNAAHNIVFSDNSVIFDPEGAFKDIQARDYHPTENSGFIDTANSNFSPSHDIEGSARPVGNGPDKGAFEFGGTPNAGGNTPNEVSHQTQGSMPMKREVINNGSSGAMPVEQHAEQGSTLAIIPIRRQTERRSSQSIVPIKRQTDQNSAIDNTPRRQPTVQIHAHGTAPIREETVLGGSQSVGQIQQRIVDVTTERKSTRVISGAKWLVVPTRKTQNSR